MDSLSSELVCTSPYPTSASSRKARVLRPSCKHQEIASADKLNGKCIFLVDKTLWLKRDVPELLEAVLSCWLSCILTLAPWHFQPYDKRVMTKVPTIRTTTPDKSACLMLGFLATVVWFTHLPKCHASSL